jgi:hypothetical protein
MVLTVSSYFSIPFSFPYNKTYTIYLKQKIILFNFSFKKAQEDTINVKVKVKVKLYLSSTKHHAMKAYWGVDV